MASNGQEKTEAPTPKRIREAREKGQVIRSADLTGAVVLAVTVGVLLFGAGSMLEQFKDLMRDGLIAAGLNTQVTPQSSMELFQQMTWRAVKIVAPLAAAAAGAAIVVGGVQTQFLFAPKAVKPTFSKLNPMQGAKRMLGPHGMFELAKALAKMAVIAVVAALVLKGQLAQMGARLGMDAEQTMAFMAELTMQLLIAVTIAYVVLAVADYLWQRYDTTKQLKMTKEEVKQEFRQSEGSPELRAAIRKRQRDAAQRRMMADVPQADVIITNPTHYAVALKYDAADPAPKVLAKGTDLVARKIREVATANGVELHENPPLARSLHASCDVGDFVPAELFVSVAEVLAYIYRARNGR